MLTKTAACSRRIRPGCFRVVSTVEVLQARLLSIQKDVDLPTLGRHHEDNYIGASDCGGFWTIRTAKDHVDA